MNRKLLLSMLALALMTALAAGSCESPKNQSESTPTQSAISATASATYEEEINRIIKDLVLSKDAPTIKDERVDKKSYYTDSSGTNWIGFVVSPIPEGVTDPAYGIMKKIPGGNWELVNLGTGGVECGLPADVQSGLGFPVFCPE
jgi:hypothetical protein